MNLVEEAKKIENGHACPEDIDLLVKVLDKLGDTPTVVMLGAGEIFMLTVFGVKPKAVLYSIDINPESHGWENVAKDNCEVQAVNHVQIIGNSPDVAKTYKGPKIDLLIIDSDHSLEGVWDDLTSWERHMNKDLYYVFCHDYDAEEAPYYYPGVKQACDKHFTKRFSWRAGWSAAWKVVGR